MIDLQREGDVFVLRLDHGENRFNPDSLAAWGAALDEVEGAEGPKALVTTGTGKFYSNGLDLDWMMTQATDEERAGYLPSVLAVMKRILTFPAITVAAINGHAFGAGGQIAVGHDYRVMRADRGFFCMPEIDMRSPLHPGMTAILQSRLPIDTVHRVLTEGHRWTAPEALEAGIVQHIVPEEEVMAKAVELAAPLAPKAHPVMSRIKSDLYPKTIEALSLSSDVLEDLMP